MMKWIETAVWIMLFVVLSVVLVGYGKAMYAKATTSSTATPATASTPASGLLSWLG